MSFDDLARPPLDQRALEQALVRTDSWVRSVTVSPETESTNADVAAMAAAGAPEGTVVTTDHQLSGKGRLGRRWAAPARSGLAVSVLLRPEVPAARWPWLPLLAGVAVVEAVVRSTEVAATLKWPNDVLVGDRKVAGILLERVETGAGPAAVVGIGLNVSLRADELPVAGATSLVLEGSDVDRTLLLRALVRTLETLYQAWVTEGGDPASGLQESYVRRCATIGQQVRADLPNGDVVVGEAVAIDGSGRLVISSVGSDGPVQRVVGAGDVLHLHATS